MSKQERFLIIFSMILSDIVAVASIIHQTNMSMRDLIATCVLVIWSSGIYVLVFHLFDTMKNKFRFGIPIATAMTTVLVFLIMTR